MNKEEILKFLEGSLLTDEELAEGADAWEEYEDPFDDWEIMFESDDEEDEDEVMGGDERGCGHGLVHGASCKHGHKH
jgi:hypothetical protein